jgi:uncharacterized protein YjbJ (UPF0337 family)
MDNDRIKGAAEQISGGTKIIAGKITGDAKLQTEGQIEKVEGKIHSAIGAVKDVFKK